MADKIVTTEFPFWVMSKEADEDYLLSRMLHFLGGTFYSRTGLFAQQACEKYMKAVSIQWNRTYPEIHKLKKLADYCKPCDELFAKNETLQILERFDLFDQVGRYGAAAKFDPMSSGQSVGGMVMKVSGMQVAGAATWTSKNLNELDELVFKIRSLLNFKKVTFDDGIKSILENNRKNYLLSTWKGKTPLRVILTKENAYFRR